MSFQLQKNRTGESRKRGAMLTDALLSLGVIMMIIVMFAYNNQREAQSQQDRMTAMRVEMISDAAKSYVGEQYDEIRETMAESGGAATLVLTLAELSDTGYLSGSTVTGAAGNVFEQDYRLFIRGVLRSDTNWPQATLSAADIASLNAPDANGVPRLINGLFTPSDDEMDLEAILLSEGGNPIPLRRGSNITGYSGNPTMGYIREEGGVLTATGNLGSFQMPLTPWETDLGAVAEEGHLLTLISLSDGVPRNGGNANIRGALQRCYDLASDSEREACLQDGNNMYSNVVFSHIAGATLPFDEYPGIEGLKKIACRTPDSSTRPTGDIDSSFDMIYVDCGEVVISDNLSIQNGDLNVQEGDINVENGTIILNGNEISDNLIMAHGEGSNGQTLPASPLTEQCPLRADGTRMNYKVQVWVTEMIESVGRPLAGHRVSFRDGPDPATGQFVLDVVGFVNEDFCRNVSGSTLSPGNVGRNMTISNFSDSTDGSGLQYYTGGLCGSEQGLAGDGDGYPDAFYLNDTAASSGAHARIQYAVYCE